MEVTYTRLNFDEYVRLEGRYRPPSVNTDTTFFVAKHGDSVFGEVAFSPGENALLILMLDSYVYRQGIARSLVSRVELEAQQQGYSEVFVDSTNHSFWRHMGYDVANSENLMIRGCKHL